jgi:hypothetical protein
VIGELLPWLREQVDEDERWARAASQAYPYTAGEARVPPDGVHWRWVTGDVWETAIPDPVVNEFVAEHGYSCWLVTVEEWPSGTTGRPMPRSYANSIVEMDSAAAGHIIRHDPARVLAEVAAKRRILDEYERAFERRRAHPDDMASAGALLALHGAVKLLALPFADRPGFREEWRP